MGSRFRTRVALILSKVLFFLLPRLRSTQRFLSSQLSCRCQDMTGCFKGLLFLINDMPAKLHCCSREVQRNSQHLREKGLEGMWGDSVHALPRATVAVLSTRGNVFRSTEVPFSLISSLCWVGSRDLGRPTVLNKRVHQALRLLTSLCFQGIFFLQSRTALKIPFFKIRNIHCILYI